MSDSESIMSNTGSLPADRLAFRVTLRDVDGFEGFDSRQFVLALNSTFPIGRASKNNAKANLMPANSNAYIDSPVISREHAVLSANANSGEPQVYIIDKGSMHGTIVNGERLPAHTPTQLSTGDRLQFGIDVNRNEGTPSDPVSSHSTDPSPSEFFVARKYEFEAHLNTAQSTPFSKGFTVPDSDEGIDGMTPSRGSQLNPLTIDDSESDSSEDELADTTLFGKGYILDVDEVEEDDEDDNAPVVADIDLDKAEHPHSLRVNDAAPGERDSEMEGSGYYSSDIQDDDIDEFDSQASIMGESIAGYDSDLGVPETQPQTSSDVTQPPTEAQHVTSMLSLEPTRAVFPNPEQNLIRNTFDPLQHVYMPPPSSVAQPSRYELQSDAGYVYPNKDYNPVPSHGHWDPVPLPTYGSYTEDYDMGSSTTNMRTPSLGFFSSSTPPPSRRTKVSIGEIVEDQPPTPESLNSMKRKADVLEDSETPAASSLPVSSVSVTEAVEVESAHVAAVTQVTSTPAQTAAVIAQRPKKQPKSILARLQTTAKVLSIGAAGAAGALAVLSALPDAFFV
jgi:pSer/pThr/pTyr-binding forkhead associated (FHA) protein